MNSADHPGLQAGTAEHPATDTATASQAALTMEARLSHLFRASLKSGRIHPLYLPVLRYRLSRVDA